jgi:hypothetical protein
MQRGYTGTGPRLARECHGAEEGEGMWITDAGEVDGAGGEGAHREHKGRRCVHHLDPRVSERGCPPFGARCCMLKGSPSIP